MIRIGITGSLASGKSTVAKIISKGKYPIFSADKTVANLYKRKSFQKRLTKIFNLQKKKNIKRELGSVIQYDKKKLKKLEQIVHPLVRKEMKKKLRKKNNLKLSIFEIPLLIESKLMKYFNVIIFVSSTKRLRLKRYIDRKGNKKIFTILDSRQFKPTKKIKICDHVIYNNKNIKSLKKRVKEIIRIYE